MAIGRKPWQSKVASRMCGGLVLLMLLVVGRNLAGSETPALRLFPLFQPNAVTPTGELLEVDPDPRAEQLAERLRQRMASFTQATQGQTAQFTQRQHTALTQLRTRAHGDVSVWLRPSVGTPMQMNADVLTRAQRSFLSGTADHQATAQAFLQANRDLLRLEDPPAELELTRSHTDELGRTHLRFDQIYDGLAVWPAELIVHLDPNGHVDLLNGAFVPTPQGIETVPVLDEAAATESARTAVPDGAAAEVAASELIIYAPGNTPPRLAWKLELDISLASHWLVVIDAENGAELTAYNQVMHGHVDQHKRVTAPDLFDDPRSLDVWEQDSHRWMIDTSKPMFDSEDQGPDGWIQRGAIWVRDAQNQEILIDAPVVRRQEEPPHYLPDAVSAAYNLSKSYDYFFEEHDQDSFDDKGASIHAIVRYRQDYKNAFWSPGTNLLVFGDGLPFAGALDIVGHELTHGVIEHSANLLYQDQPGALNEAFADIFGEMIEARTSGSPDWITGQDLMRPDLGGRPDLGRPVRNLKDPGAFSTYFGRPYPTKMSEFFHIQEDNGGVHINSSIINHAFYLLAEGLDGAIGLRKSERIFYRALTKYLVQNSQFIDARLACIRAAKELFGPGEVQKTRDAFDAVEIFDAGPTPDPPDIPSVRGPDATLFVYRDVLGQFRLGRREAAQGDGGQGVQLAEGLVVRARPSVSRDGSLAFFVNAENHPCFIATDGNEEECIEFSSADTSYDTVASVALSPDGQLLGVVFPDDLDAPANRISVLNLATGVAHTFLLPHFSYSGPASGTLPSASTMNFTADGQWLIYDAQSAVTVSGDEDHLILRDQWSLYALHLQTGRGFPLLLPSRRGIHIAFPALGQTSDNFLTFDVFDETRNQSTVRAADLSTGVIKTITTVRGGFGMPGYTGDDTALVYSQRDPGVSTGFSLVRRPLAPDRITPKDPSSIWLRNAEFGVIYRRRPSRPGLTGRLENPSPGSFQSGVGLFSGWVCDATPGGPAVPEVAERYFYDALEGRESSVDNRGNWWARTGSTNGTHITGRTTVQEVVDQVRRFTISYVDDNGYDRTEFYETLLDESGIFTLDIGNVRLSWTIAGLLKSTLPPPLNDPTAVIPPRVTIDVIPGATVRNQDGSPWEPVPLTQTMGELGREMHVVNILEPYVPGASEVSTVEIEICDASNNCRPRLQAAYGTDRRDTAGVCADSNSGFALLWNWNLLGDGQHTVRAFADGIEFDSATFTVTTLGTEFLTDKNGEILVPNFPTAETDSVVLRWQEAQQNFVITNGRAGGGGGTSGSPPRVLENPQPGSFQSGIGVISGWVCEASQIEIEFDDDAANRWLAGYGTQRSDTAGVCGDTDNGFGLLFNWNLLGDGQHTVRAFADGLEFGNATFTVKTLGTEFLTGVRRTETLPDFPTRGTNVVVEWQEASQNFVITRVE